MTIALLILALSGVLFTGWLGALSPWSQNEEKKSLMKKVQWGLLILTMGISFALLGEKDFLHFFENETLASTAMVLAIVGVASFDFGLVPKSKTSLWWIVGVITPALSNLGTSVLVLPLALGVSKYVFQSYPKGQAILIMLVVTMMSANTLAVGTFQADLPTTAYYADQLAGEMYTQGGNALEALLPAGVVGFAAYLAILWGLGVRPRSKEKWGMTVTDRWSLVSAILICGWFILAMNQKDYQTIWYASGILVAFAIGWIKTILLPKPSDISLESWKDSSLNHPRELWHVYVETGVMFFTIFGFISWIPMEGLRELAGSNPWLQPLLVVIETLFSDNLIAYNANKALGFQGDWNTGIATTLYGSIGYGAHFLMGHVVLIVYWLQQMPKKIGQEELQFLEIDDEAHRPGISRWVNQTLSKEYRQMILPMSLMASVCLLPLTVGSQVGIYFGGTSMWILPILGGVVAILLFKVLGKILK